MQSKTHSSLTSIDHPFNRNQRRFFTYWMICALMINFMAFHTVYAGDKSEKAAAKVLKAKLAHDDPEALKVLEKITSKEIVVVAGSMDHIEQILDAGQIKYTFIKPHQVAESDLHADQIVMINCPGKIPDPGLKRIEQFVRAGGLLYTTDWSLKNVIEKVFPGTIKYNGRATRDHVTPVQIVSLHDNLMSQILLRDNDQPQWWLERSSYPIQIIDKKKVQVLAKSQEMKNMYKASPVVVRFPWHDGEVIHIVSHFYRQVKTKGKKVSAKKEIKNLKGLSQKQKEALAKDQDTDVQYSDMASSYSFQRMTSNIITGKHKKKKALDKKYKHTTNKSVKIGKRKVKKGERLKVLWEKDGKVNVRDDRGNEAVLPADDVKLR